MTTTTEWPEATPNQFFVHVPTGHGDNWITIAGYPTEPTQADLKTAGLIKTETYRVVTLAGKVLVKPTPVRVVTASELVIVKLSEDVPLSEIFAGLNVAERLGPAANAGAA